MGLDMYLHAKKTFYDASWKKEKDEESKMCEKLKEIVPEIYKSGNLNDITIEFEVGYWRKANQIHNWFVENVQDGKDDCGYYHVNKKDLKKLLTLCKEVLSKSKLIKGTVINGYRGSKEGNGLEPIYEDGEVIVDPSIAKDLLPTTSGFFFGGTEYNEYYIHKIKNTIEIIEKALTLPKGWSFSYHSSW